MKKEQENPVVLYPKRSTYEIHAYIGVVWGVNVGIYSSPMECMGNSGHSMSWLGLRSFTSFTYSRQDPETVERLVERLGPGAPVRWWSLFQGMWELLSILVGVYACIG